MNKTSRLFWPVLVTPKNAVVKSVEATSRSQKLMTELGLIKPASNGTFQIMPLAQRALDKCVDLVHRRMRSVEAQKLSLPVLTSTALWRKSGRLDGDISEFYIVRDRHSKEFLLSPTHEEAVTAMLASAAPVSYRQLPLRLYQVGPKFRDELKARFGLMRAKEFLMKDLYTFDRTAAEARDTYAQVNEAYEKFFRQLEVPFERVSACAGMMGGSETHEYHYLSETGEDRIFLCTRCNHGCNAEVADAATKCPRCESSEVREVRGIEVAHAFLLGDKYSRPLGASFLGENGKPEPLLMGCYGVGVSRLVAAAAEVLSSDTELRWPTLLAPFDVCLIGPKQGSKEQATAEGLERSLYPALVDIFGAEEVLLDDRKSLTIGKRLKDAQKMGYPVIVVVGAKAAEAAPRVELFLNGRRLDLSPEALLQSVREYGRRKEDLLNQ